MIIGRKERDVTQDIVLVTGSGHGIGKETALQYSKLGATGKTDNLQHQENVVLLLHCYIYVNSFDFLQSFAGILMK